ncbi:hypothetical protein [Mesohalobacter halotolerans]|uniref:Lipoprotein n=1 Tax=Mesohalobacter halotolerans TaxID=1883405 RepID=A0A4U5TQ36_9FLAO|nr:hypothetical protein [Mesohalobacter halotolerans]TKS55841.1 hypothetical protein FCN74_07340 [Mesohalobacter halotolerans]
MKKIILRGIIIVSSVLMAGCSQEAQKPEEIKVSELNTPCDYLTAIMSHGNEMLKILGNPNFSNLEYKKKRTIFRGLSQVERERLFLLYRSVQNMGRAFKINDFDEDDMKECEGYKDFILLDDKLDGLERFLD